MSDPIRDLDDVEAIAWALAWPTVWAFSNRSCDVAAENADECVRLLRERRRTRPHDGAERIILGEREKIVAWLRQRHRVAAMFADHIARGEHDR